MVKLNNTLFLKLWFADGKKEAKIKRKDPLRTNIINDAEHGHRDWKEMFRKTKYKLDTRTNLYWDVKKINKMFI